MTFDEPWQRRIVEDIQFWDAFGCPIHPRSLPTREHRAVMAVLRGREREHARRQREQEREARKNKRGR